MFVSVSFARGRGTFLNTKTESLHVMGDCVEVKDEILRLSLNNSITEYYFETN